jgi:hypothetical protein
MEDITMATLHIKVKNHPEISGKIPMPFTGATTYTCPLGVFAIAPTLTVGSGPNPTISGSFSIPNVPDNYGTVSFSGTYVSKGGGGSGSINWTGSHLRGPEEGSDTWTSDTTTPEPKLHRSDAKAKGKGGAY